MTLRHYKTIVTKTVDYWHSDRQVGKWNRMESTEMGPHNHCELVLLKRQRQFSEERTHYSINDAETIRYLYMNDEL